MGWNSWDCYGAAVNEEQLLGNAQYVADHTVFTNMFNNATKIENITIEGIIGNDFSIISNQLIKESIVSIVSALSTSTIGKTLTLSKTAIQTAFGEDYDSSTEWVTLKNSKSNWTITLS